MHAISFSLRTANKTFGEYVRPFEESEPKTEFEQAPNSEAPIPEESRSKDDKKVGPFDLVVRIGVLWGPHMQVPSTWRKIAHHVLVTVFTQVYSLAFLDGVVAKSGNKLKGKGHALITFAVVLITAVQPASEFEKQKLFNTREQWMI